jgi:molybdate transport system substrate-binding protein
LQGVILLALLLLLAACGGNSGALWGPGGYQGNTVTNNITNQGGIIIQAAPTLQFVLPALANAFFTTHGLNVPYVFDFSGTKVIATNVNTLADNDLLISDDRRTMINARNIGFTRSVGTVVATDSLTVILPAGNPGNIHTLQDLAIPGHRYIGINANDGLNTHIQATLESMILDPAFGQQYSARVYGNIVADYTDGVSAARALASSPPPGDFAIVYRTNYLAALKERGTGALTQLAIPAQFNPPVEIIAAITGQAMQPRIDQDFIDFLRTPQANAIWAAYGFTPAT